MAFIPTHARTHRTPKYHGLAHHALAEREATHRAITFAEFLGAPLLLVHVSGREAVDEIAAARGSERGYLPIFGETCPQYLTLTAEKLNGVVAAEEEEEEEEVGHGHGHGHEAGEAGEAGEAAAQEDCSHGHAHGRTDYGEWEGAKYLCSPPLRSQRDLDALWLALQQGTIQVVSSDHSAYNFLPPGPGPAVVKASPHDDDQPPRKTTNPAAKLMKQGAPQDAAAAAVDKPSFAAVPMGLPGLETRMSLLFSYGVLGGRIDLPTFANVCATNPAKLYGLYLPACAPAYPPRLLYHRYIYLTE